jgi:predicted nucleic acid-binding protein
MKAMNVRYFLDSNIALYLFDKDPDRVQKVKQLLETHPVISTQVANEFINVCLRKFRFPMEETFQYATALLDSCEVMAMDESITRSAMDLCLRYKLSNWDALIVAAALQADCSILYTEDMQHEQAIEKQLKLINPFL